MSEKARGMVENKGKFWNLGFHLCQKIGYGDPTAAKLGIPVDWVDYTGGLSEVKAQKEAGKITWDIMDVYAKDSSRSRIHSRDDERRKN